MDTLQINNPFGVPVYFQETVKSTMDEARLLTGERSGTVIVADEQSAGRGRSGRRWNMNKGENLSFTIMFCYGSIEAIPRCLTLRTGLAVACAIEDFTAFFIDSYSLPPGNGAAVAGVCMVKWPNDVMLLDREGQGRKAAGILTEADNGTVYIGVGVNIVQRDFPPELAHKACSIGQVLSEENDQNKLITEHLLEKRFILLEKILFRLFDELENDNGKSDWRNRLEEKLYMKNRKITFVPGLPEELSNKPVPAIEGTLLGIGEEGEIRILEDTGKVVSYANGELRFR
ncbi:MAG: biotin--[acetyl-CoA-carboxylase] ligase [Treponema sp.]|nr:biotin--[acetyl-CoA-carboxylase] ligase [Treponema sp.]